MDRKTIRKQYKELIDRSKVILDKFDVTDKGGRVSDRGHSMVYEIHERYRTKGNVDDCIAVVGKKVWSELLEIWSEMKKLNKLEREEFNKNSC